jgi:hypothetical protein
VFQKAGKKISHTWGSELVGAKEEPGQNART